jgi:hypothetical protein
MLQVFPAKIWFSSASQKAGKLCLCSAPFKIPNPRVRAGLLPVLESDAKHEFALVMNALLFLGELPNRTRVAAPNRQVDVRVEPVG